MVSMDRLARTVREQVALGRLLPLGGPEDAAWITERTAVAALRTVCAALPGVRLGRVDVLPAADGDGGPDEPDLPAAAPLGALPHRPLRIKAGFEAVVGEPLPVMAERLRTALFAAAGEDGLGLPVRVVDLAVTGLIDDPEEPSAAVGSGRGRTELEGDSADDEESGQSGVQGTAEAARAAEAAVRAVPGVARLTRRLTGRGGVRVRDTEAPAGPARHVQLQIATARSFRPLAVAREAATAATTATTPGAPGPVSTAVIITDIT
ncbi:nucleopolyhedrovirus P10 family protein [Streptomyces sp. NBC_00669]|uniref:nucleopolyhedrovirus P10 family protein n=1 Tax=Streptomyces sp. NBC_00669 TaxID=2976011 RepID=UPI002E32F7FC|nr:nucleopolyhedrovirus P10 family protein [Streptomyces sp. NBC_00669]